MGDASIGDSLGRKLGLAIAGIVAMVAVVLVPGAPAQAKGTSASSVTFAEQPGSPPNYIFPMMSGAYFDSTNQEQFQYLMYLPLYWFGKDGKPVLNPSLSAAYPPVYSNGDTVVTVRMKGWKWSNGETVDARDVIFWMNLLEQEKTNFGPYAAGTFPDNVKAYKMVAGDAVRFTLEHSFSPYWFTYNELSQVTPMPMAWDREAGTAPGAYDATPSGARAVYNYLIGQAKNLPTYDTNPLWRVVDGPWRLQTYDSNGYVVFARNHSYSGKVSGSVSKFILEPFTSDTAEFNALRSGAVDYGYIPPQDTAQAGVLKKRGYSVVPWWGWAFTYIDLDYLNPQSGPILSQPYVRQALQMLIDQPQLIKAVYDGLATITNGPVPLKPASNFVSSLERKGLYSYNPKRAESVLKEHGWRVVPGGTSSCVRPGAGANECGAGIGEGDPLQFQFLYSSGMLALQTESALLQSSLERRVCTLP